MRNFPIWISLLTCCVLPTVESRAASSNIALNALTNQSEVNSVFDYIPLSADSSCGSFAAATNGINLQTFTTNSFEAAYLLKNSVSATNSWTATVKVHVSSFATSQTNPWYSAGLYILTGSDGTASLDKYLATMLVRSDRQGLANSLVVKNLIAGQLQEEFYLERTTTNSITITDLYLRVSYDALTKTLTSRFSTNGETYSTGTVWNLGELWGLTHTNSFWIALAAGNTPTPTGNPPPAVYNVQLGDIYLRDFRLSRDAIAQAGQTLLGLEKSTNGMAQWFRVPVTPDMITSDGWLNQGTPNSASGFFRMRITNQ